MSEQSNTPQFSRRAFLEAVGAAGALGMVGGSSLLSFGAAAAEGKSGDILTGSHWGAFRAKVKDGRIAGYTLWEKDPQPTHMLKGLIDSVYAG